MAKVHRAPVIEPLRAKTAGRVKKMNADLIGRASLLLGAGRQRAGDQIDFAVGLSDIKKIGEHIDVDEPLLTIHARDKASLRLVRAMVQQAFAIG